MYKKLASIDIGSNAIRLLINSVKQQTHQEVIFKKLGITRLPIRLGADVFDNGFISSTNIHRLIDAMHAYKYIMRVHGVKHYKATATSAMREAQNGYDVVNQIEKKTNIDIEIIDGKTEAEIIFSTQLSSLISDHQAYLYVDVGGGSTEMTFFDSGRLIKSQSFKIGTIRLLSKKVPSTIWDNIRNWLKEVKSHQKISIIGSGGNINTVFKRSLQEKNTAMNYAFIEKTYNLIKPHNIQDRINLFDLKPDRADVIIPALEIFLFIMKQTHIQDVYAPKIGLADGLIRKLYAEIKP